MARERRKDLRVQWQSSATIHDLDNHLICACILSDFSNGGAKLTTVDASTIPDQFILGFARGRSGRRKCRVLWRSNGMLGVEFADAITNVDEPGAALDAKPLGDPKGRVSISYR
jgi:PilZ domain